MRRSGAKRPGYSAATESCTGVISCHAAVVSEQRLQQAVVQRVAGPMRDEPAAQRSAGKCQVADRIQQLVTDELVGHAQAGEVQHPRLIDHHRVLQTAAPGKAGGAELVDLLRRA